MVSPHVTGATAVKIFTSAEKKAALTAIADGTQTECHENEYSIYQYLEEGGYIKGRPFGLNRFQRTHLTLTNTGTQLMASL